MNSPIKGKIKKIRELKNLTQKYMAENLGITQAAYSKIEKKGLRQISFEKLEKIAEILEVGLDDIINFDLDNYFLTSKKSDKSNAVDVNLNKMEKLYQDKVVLLERLLYNIDSELKRYKEKFGAL